MIVGVNKWRGEMGQIYKQDQNKFQAFKYRSFIIAEVFKGIMDVADRVCLPAGDILLVF